MLVANTADWHIGGKDLEAAEAQLNALVEACDARMVHVLTIAGDVFERPNVGDNHGSTGAVAGVAVRAVKRLTDVGIEVIIVHGQHDQSGPGSAPATRVFQGMPLVRISQRARIVLVGDLSIACLPWCWEGGDPVAIIRDARIAIRPTMLLAHIQVIGGLMSKTFTCEAKPGQWQIKRGELAALPFDRYALGDFHKRHDLFNGRGGYVGALRQLNFGEAGNPAGFEIWNTETGEVEWIELDAAPRYRTVEIDSADAGGLLASESTTPGDNERLRVRLTGGQPVAAEDVRRLAAAGVSVEHVVERVERVQRAEVPAGIMNDPRGLMELWAANQVPPVEGERLARMLRVYDAIMADEATVGAPKQTAAPDDLLAAAASASTPF